MAATPLRVPATLFTDPLRLAAEKKHIFRSLPLVAGFSTSIAKPGDAMLFNGTGDSIIIVRGTDGKANAFLNLCTHRGTQLVKERGNHLTISCPFHGWTFDTQGKPGQLIGQPGSEGFAGIDKNALGLIPVPCTELHGLIFVKGEVAKGAANGTFETEVESFLGDYGPQLALYEFDRYVPGKSGLLQSAGNWKYISDTFAEGYHFAALHPDTLGSTHFNNVATYDQYGVHHRICFATKNYKDFMDKPESEWVPADAVVHTIFPNTHFIFGCPRPGSIFIQMFHVYPREVNDTEIDFTLYVTPELQAAVGREFVEGAFDLAAGIVSNEDFVVAANAQRMMAGVPADFKVTYGRNEIGPQNYQHNIANAIGMPLK